ncbi:MAG: alpha/beta hydrolase [Candidatus Hydrogenedentes bacterium]|nr:alpha/beta hydrolase [Candidatus Hydrogenedentota bacterium]
MWRRLVILWRILRGRRYGKYFDANGVRIHYRVTGEGAPVVLIHGITSNADGIWGYPGTTDLLAARYQIIAMDVRGHGLSDKPHEQNAYGLELVHDVARLLDHLGIKKAHIIGYSLGALITIKFVALYPERIITAAPCGAGRVEDTPENRALVASLQQGLQRTRDFTPLFTALDPRGRQPGRLRMAILNWYLRRTNDVEAIAALAGSLENLVVHDEELQHNPVPVLSVIGSRDPMKGAIDRMTGLLPHHEVIVLDHCDHFTTFFSRRFQRTLLAFLNDGGKALCHEPPALLQEPVEIR